jgi:hypothetical protein
MKQVTLKLTALVMLMGGAISAANAQVYSNSNQLNVVTTAVPFLRVSPDARSAGMGDIGISTSADAYSNFWNSGKTAFSQDKVNVGLTYTPWLSDLKLNDVYLLNLAGFYKFDDLQAITFGLRYFSLGNIQFTDANGQELNKFRPREYSVDLGYSRKLGKKDGLGISLHYISSDLAGGNVGGVSYKKGTAVAGDLHYFHNGVNEAGNGFNWGITLSNLGSKISYTSDATQKDYLPANFGIGASYNKAVDPDNKILIGLEMNKLLVPTPPLDDTSAQALKDYRSKGVVSSWFSSFGDADQDGGEFKEITWSVGAEYSHKDQFFFRLGYFYENKLKGDRRYFTMGAGLKYSVFGLNLSYIIPSGSGVNRMPLSNTIRFGLTFGK